jgi:hypothetical protein
VFARERAAAIDRIIQLTEDQILTLTTLTQGVHPFAISDF